MLRAPKIRFRLPPRHIDFWRSRNRGNARCFWYTRYGRRTRCTGDLWNRRCAWRPWHGRRPDGGGRFGSALGTCIEVWVNHRSAFRTFDRTLIDAWWSETHEFPLSLVWLKGASEKREASLTSFLLPAGRLFEARLSLTKWSIFY